MSAGHESAAASSGEGTLRVPHAALAPGRSITFTFDGRAVDALEGECIAAALTAAGIATMGRRRDGRPRGLWCGMGVCQECIVTVDGISGRRACVTTVSADANVASQGYEGPAAQPEPRGPPVERAPETTRVDLLIVGAGPAGLAAAEAAARAGVRATVLDERLAAGGQYFKQPAKSHRLLDARLLDRQARDGLGQVEKVQSLGVDLVADATVWGAFDRHEIAATVAGRQQVFAPERFVVATGVYERGVAMPGWTLPGYLTTGAAQTLLRAYRVLPGRRILVAGNGPLNLQLAAELVEAGAHVAALVESAPRPGPGQALDVARALAAAPHLVLRGMGYLSTLRAAGVPVLYGSAVMRAEGIERVESCTVGRVEGQGTPSSGDMRTFEVDTICAGYGFRPSNEILRALGCRHEPRDNVLAPVVDEDGLTSIEGVYAVGDVAGLLGAHAARCQGFIAGCAAARSLGLELPRDVQRDLRSARRRLHRHRAFQQALWRLFAAPSMFDQLATDDTVLCRCESVDCGRIAGSIRAGARSIGAIKRRTRAGMGRCQGRYCEALVAARARALGIDMSAEVDHWAPRAPIKPMRIDDLI